MSSWVYSDPAPPILKAYVGDPSKIRLIHGGIKETHVFHLHNHQWRLEGENPNSTIIDSISISPQECYTLDILHGAGSLNGMIGDAIFHCHLYPHFHEGMWTLWRIYDRLEDGTGHLPDGTVIPPLLPLKERKAPPKKDKKHPGYPNFINGTFREAPLQPPLGILDADGENKIEPTDLEVNNFVPNFEPDALYTDTCPCHTDAKHGCPCPPNGKPPYPHEDEFPVKTATDDGEEVDDEDTGEKGYNYHSERFANRLIKDHRVSKVFSSRVHGDPATPVFTAYPYERVIFRVLRNNFGHKCKNACRKLFERICK